MGGGGKGGGGATIPPEVEEAAATLQGIGREQFGIGTPLLETGGTQALDILRTGSTAALEPAIRSTIEQGRSDASQQLRTLQEQLVRQGVTGTGFQNALGDATFNAESQLASIPTQFALPTLEQIGGEAFSLPAQGLQSLGGAATAGANAAVPGQQSGGALGALGGAASGALSGAKAGSVVPGVGTAIGAVAGGVTGAAKGGK